MSFISENFGDATEREHDRMDELKRDWELDRISDKAESEPEICGYCNGSGEGMTDGARCRVCKGRGEI